MTRKQRSRRGIGRPWEWLDASSWDEFASRSPGATGFHARAWSEAVAAHDRRFEARAAGLELASGELAVLPMVVRRGLHRRGPLGRAVSTQPGTYGGPILRDRLLTPEDWAEVFEILAGLGIGRLDCFGNVLDPLPDGLHVEGLATTRCRTHVVALDALPEDPRSTYRQGCRRGLRKAEAAGLSFRRITTRAELEPYYAIYIDRLRNAWGKAVEKAYPMELFGTLMEAPGAEIWCAYDSQGEVAAGAVFLFAPRHCVYWQGALSTRHGGFSPSKALMHHLILEARSRGCAWFDFNPSSGLAGVEAFKRGFGAAEVEVTRWRRLSPLVRLTSRSRR